jgi:hypothetical protein
MALLAPAAMAGSGRLRLRFRDILAAKGECLYDQSRFLGFIALSLLSSFHVRECRDSIPLLPLTVGTCAHSMENVGYQLLSLRHIS